MFEIESEPFAVVNELECKRKFYKSETKSIQIGPLNNGEMGFNSAENGF